VCALTPVSVLAFVGQSSSAGPPAPGTWKLSGGMVTDTETNSSGSTIHVFYLVLPAGVNVTGGPITIPSPPGICYPGQGKTPAPNQIECQFGSEGGAGWENGTTITFSFPVEDPLGKLSTNPPPTLQKYIDHTFNPSNYEGPFELPPATTTTVTTTTTQRANTPPPEEPKPCKCVKLSGSLSHFHIFGKGSTRIEFDVDWEMTCSPGAGNCSGEILVLAPRGARFLEQNGKKFPPKDKPTIVHIKCVGPCDSTTKGKTTVSYLALINVKDKKGREHTVPIPRFLPEGRANKSVEIRVSIICANPPGTVKKLKLSFDKYGQVSHKKSRVKF
jgi:hypothetical protein